MTAEGRVSSPIHDEPTWANGQPITDEQARNIALLRAAGCRCPRWPLLGYRPGVGPRCRLCNVVAPARVPSPPSPSSAPECGA